jgi:hypothetical protein
MIAQFNIVLIIIIVKMFVKKNVKKLYTGNFDFIKKSGDDGA